MLIVSEEWTLSEISADEDALKNLIGDLYLRCLQLARGDHLLGEDITQHILYKALQTEEVFLGYASFKRWSDTCARNKFLDEKRKDRIHSNERTYKGSVWSGRLKQVGEDEEPSENQLDARIAAALMAIPLIHRQILEKIAQEKSYSEIASELSLEQSQVRRKLHYAREILRPRLLQVYAEHFGREYTNCK